MRLPPLVAQAARTTRLRCRDDSSDEAGRGGATASPAAGAAGAVAESDAAGAASQRHTVVARVEDGGKRVDQVLAQLLPAALGVTRSRVQRGIKDGSVLLNGAPVKKISKKVDAGDTLRFTLTETVHTDNTALSPAPPQHRALRRDTHSPLTADIASGPAAIRASRHTFLSGFIRARVTGAARRHSASPLSR